VGREIERKFLVTGDEWRQGAKKASYRQGYLCLGPPAAVRVRIADGKATLNIKEATADISRAEFEYGIPVDEAESILAHLITGNVIEKTRYTIAYADRSWEVDVFHGPNEGLVLAELEIDSEADVVALPPWVGEEVSNDPRYFNTHLAAHPYPEWAQSS